MESQEPKVELTETTRVLTIVKEQLEWNLDFNWDETPIDELLEKRLIADLWMDSLDAVELVMSLEDEYGKEINESEAEDFFANEQDHTLREFIEFVQRQFCA